MLAIDHMGMPAQDSAHEMLHQAVVTPRMDENRQGIFFVYMNCVIHFIISTG